MQRNVGDCYFVAAYEGLLRHRLGQQLISKMIEQVDGGQIYKITFPGFPDSPQIVRYSELRAQSRWLLGDLGDMYIERAFGRLMKQHQPSRIIDNDSDDTMVAIDGGYPSDAVHALTGAQKYDVSLVPMEKNKIFKELDALAKSPNKIMCVSFDRDTNHRRFIENHAYLVKRIEPTKNKVYLINPHNTLKTVSITYQEFASIFTHISGGFIPE